MKRPDRSAMLRPRRLPRARGVAAQHASLSRWRSPVRIRSGPPLPSIYPRPVRPPGRGVLLPSVTIRAVKRLPVLVVLGLVALAIAVPVSGGLLGFGATPASPPAASDVAGPPQASAPPSDTLATPEPTDRKYESVTAPV